MKQIIVNLPEVRNVLCRIDGKTVSIQTSKLIEAFPAVELPPKVAACQFVRLKKVAEHLDKYGARTLDVTAFCDRIYKQLRRIHKHLEDGNEVVTVNGLLVRTHPDSPHLVSLTDIHLAAKGIFTGEKVKGGIPPLYL